MTSGGALAALVAVAVSGCGSSVAPEKPFPPSGPSPNAVQIAIPRQLQGRERTRAVAGRLVAGHASCLACHVIGRTGNDGPGPNLSHVGSRLTRAQLVHFLRAPPPPMPSFRNLPRSQFSDLVEFLHSLR